MGFPVATFGRSAAESLVVYQDILQMESCEERRTHLLRDAEGRLDPGWFLYTPTCFNAALDIRLDSRQMAKKPYPIWTQGNQFAFDRGDILYDTPLAYQRWDRALQALTVCIQVVYASPVSQPRAQARQPGRVGFKVLKPRGRRGLAVTERYECTQDEFVRFVITGQGPGR